MAIVQLRLDIDGGSYICDTYESTALQITKSVQSLDTIVSSQGAITKQSFTVPLIRGLLDAIGDITALQGEANVDIRKVIQGSIIVDGFTRFEGSFQILKAKRDKLTNTKEVNLIFKGNETNLKSVLSDITVASLLDGDSLPYTASEINDYYDDPETYRDDNGYTWDMIDYGSNFTVGGSGTRLDDPTTPLTQVNFKPSLVVKTIFDKLAEQDINITWETEIDDLIEEQIIPLHNNENSLPVLDTAPLDGTGRVYSDLQSNSSFSLAVGASILLQVYVNQKENYTTDNFNGSNFYVPPFNGEFTFNTICNIDTRISTVSGVLQLDLDLYNNASFIETLATTKINVNTSATNVVLQSTFNRYSFTSDQLNIKVRLTLVSSFVDPVTVFWNFKEGSEFNVLSSGGVNTTSNVVPSLNVPENLTAWQVVSYVIGQCNGVLETTDDGFNIKPFNDWKDEGATFNINDKIDPTKSVSIDPTGTTGAKSIKLSYAEDTDFYNEQYTKLTNKVYGELFIPDTGSDFATDEYSLTLNSAATVPINVAGSSLRIPKFLNGEGETTKAKYRLIPSSLTAFTGQWFYLEELFSPATLYSIESIPLLGHWAELDGGYTTIDYNFGQSLTFFSAFNYPNNNLYNRFWKDSIFEQYGEDSRKVTLSLKLTKNEFTGMVLNESVYFENSLLRFNSINNYNLNKDETVSCEFVLRQQLENIDIAPFYPYDTINGVVQWKDSSDNSDLGDASTEAAADVEESCIAYGFYYDSSENLGIQRGQILTL